MQSVPVESRTGFDNFELNSLLRQGVAAAGFVEPRPIQSATIPAALEGRDILGLAQTGTGKTAAFALPVLERLIGVPKGLPRVLILAPTRELASQIRDEIGLLARFTKIRTATVFGGVSLGPQIAQLRRQPEILVACPGRLLDLHQKGAVRLENVETLVVDEADRMFDMGFLPDIRRILRALPDRRQNLLFSATMPSGIRGLTDTLLNNPHVVEMEHSKPISTVDHEMIAVESKAKLELLQRILAKDEYASAIVFTRTKHRAKRLAQQLNRAGHRAVGLQGNMSQSQRVKAMDGFRRHQFHILVATDIAARGIDVEQVSHVINFDMPDTTDAYTHRIGRTGRSGRAGKAITFVTRDDRDTVRAVERRLGGSVTQSIDESAKNDRPARPAKRPLSNQPRYRFKSSRRRSSKRSKLARAS